MALNKQRQGLNCKVFNENVCIFTACIISYLWLTSNYFNNCRLICLWICHNAWTWWHSLAQVRDAKHSTIQGRAFHTKNTLVQMTRGPCWEQPSQDGLLFPKFFKNSWQVYVILNAQTMLLDSYMPHSFISLFSTTLIIFVRETHH